MISRNCRYGGLLGSQQALRLTARAAAAAAALQSHSLGTLTYNPTKQQLDLGGTRTSDQQVPGQLRVRVTGHSMMSGTAGTDVAATAAPTPPGIVDQAAVTPCEANSADSGWSQATISYYLAIDRNWRAVEEFYMRLVSGDACLSQLGLAPAGAPALDVAHDHSMAAAAAAAAAATALKAGSQMQTHEMTQGYDGHTDEGPHAQQQQHQQQQQQPTVLDCAADDGKQQQKVKRTFKFHVSYLGSSFAGWSRQPGRTSVEETLAAAIAAAGVTGDKPAEAKAAKRAAARAARRAQKRAKWAAGDITAAVSDSTTGAHATDGAAVEGRGAGDICLHTSVVAGGSSDVGSAAARLPVISVAGRTDSGVTAAGQVISFQSWDQELQPHQLLQKITINLPAVMTSQAAAATPATVHNVSSNVGNDCSSVACGIAVEPPAPLLPVKSHIRVWAAEEVPHRFHATFSATWRRYVYLLPLRHQPQQQIRHHGELADNLNLLPQYSQEVQQTMQSLSQNEDLDKTAVHQAPDPDPQHVNTLLRQLQGRTLNYSAYARDTPKGKACECVLHTARASLVQLPLQQTGSAAERALSQTNAASVQQQSDAATQPCLCIELVGNRFLRRMVRVLVATAVRESLRRSATLKQHGDAVTGTASGAGVVTREPLVELASISDRTKTAAAAPGLGLCFAAVGYDE